MTLAPSAPHDKLNTTCAAIMVKMADMQWLRGNDELYRKNMAQAEAAMAAAYRYAR